MKWYDYLSELDSLANKLAEWNQREEFPILEELGEIFGEAGKVQGVDRRIIAFIEYAFFRAEGPYSPKFNYYADVIAKVLRLHPAMRHLLNRTAPAAIANMVLGARGRLKFEISDWYELKRVLSVWANMGLRPLSPATVLRDVLKKKVVKSKLVEGNLFLLARLKEIFPFHTDMFMPPDMNLNEAIFEHYRRRFSSLIEQYEGEGKTITDMIEQENTRLLPVGVKRNNLLAFLVKKKWDFTCQICKAVGGRSYGPVQIHHIVPLEKGGEDHSSNMIVTCGLHHSMAHRGQINVELGNKIKLTYHGKTYTIPKN